jgi:hypothetical protein
MWGPGTPGLSGYVYGRGVTLLTLVDSAPLRLISRMVRRAQGDVLWRPNTSLLLHEHAGAHRHGDMLMHPNYENPKRQYNATRKT